MSLEDLTKKTGKVLWFIAKWILTIIAIFLLFRLAQKYHLFGVIGSLLLVFLTRWGLKVADCLVGLEKVFYEGPGAWIRKNILDKSSKKAKIISSKFAAKRSNWNPLTWMIWTIGKLAAMIEKLASFLKPAIVKLWDIIRDLFPSILFSMRKGLIGFVVWLALALFTVIFAGKLGPQIQAIFFCATIIYILPNPSAPKPDDITPPVMLSKVIDFIIKINVFFYIISPLIKIFAMHNMFSSILIIVTGWFLKDFVMFFMYTQHGLRRHKGSFMTRIKHTINDWKMLHKDAEKLEEIYSEEFMKKMRSRKGDIKEFDEHLSKYIMDLVAAKKAGVKVDKSALETLRAELQESMSAEEISDLFKIIEAMKYD